MKRPPAKLRCNCRRAGRVNLGVPLFLAAFGAGIAGLSYYYLLPALRTYLAARREGNHAGTQAISATSTLLMWVVLVILAAGLLLTFRIGRFFFPRRGEPRTRTRYVDAWAEAGRRADAADAPDDDELVPPGSD